MKIAESSRIIRHVSTLSQPAKRANEFSNRASVAIQPTCLMLSLNKKFEANSFHQCIHKSRSPLRKTSTPTISKIGSNIFWFSIKDIEAPRVLLYRNFRSLIHELTIMLRVCLRFCVLLPTSIFTCLPERTL